MKKLLSFPYFYQAAGKWLPYLVVGSFFALTYGLWGGFRVAGDSVQGDAFRIMYVHVPAAFLSLGIYVVIGCCSVLYMVWHLKLADLVAASSASIGLCYTVIALLTGAIWGKPMWGTWWIWDARLTSELILCFLYVGYIGLRSALVDPRRRAQACALLGLVGLVDIPIIHFSVEWWSTLHQGPSLSKFSKPSIAWDMLWPLIMMIVFFVGYYLWAVCLQIRTHILEQSLRVTNEVTS